MEVSMSQGAVVRLNQGRKREIHPENWKDFIAKKNRSSGQPYQGRNGNYNPGLLPPANNRVCRRCTKDGCAMSQATKLQLFQDFRKVDYNAQNLVLCGGLTMEPPDAHQAGSRKEVTIQYSVLVDGSRVNVCRETFCDIFKISKRRITTISKKMRQGDLILKDRRGRHAKKKTEESIRAGIKRHIETFPTQESHYGRGGGSNRSQYLQPGLNLEKMYGLYIEKCRDEDEEEGENWVYRDVFAKKFNLKFASPKEDTCDKCDLFDAKFQNETDPNLRTELQQQKQNHLDLSEAAYNENKADIEKSKIDPSVVVVTADLQQVQFTPNLKNSSAFYLRKLSNYTFGIHDGESGDGTMCLWTENIGQRGANEISSCLWHYLTNKYGQLPQGQDRTLILWTDRCCGQNNNRMVLLTLILLVRRRYFTSVSHKFFMTGHSYNDCDRDFGVLEKESRRRSILTPTDIEDVIREARTQNPFTIKRMLQPNFLDFKSLLNILRFPTSLKVTHYHKFEYSLRNPDGIFVMEDFGFGVWKYFKVSHINRTTNRRNRRLGFSRFDAVAVLPAYGGPLKIAPEKLKDIKQLAQYLSGNSKAWFDAFLQEQDALQPGQDSEEDSEDEEDLD